MNAYQKSINELEKELQIDSQQGLSLPIVHERQKCYGYNVITQKQTTTWLSVLMSQFLNPLMIILLLAAGASFFLNEYKDSIIVLIVVVVNIIIGFVQEWRADRARQLLKSYEVSWCKVKRSGHYGIVDAASLVPGDVVVLEAGSRVPADMRLFFVADCMIDEALLTGEAKPVKKECGVLLEVCPVGNRRNMAYAGTHVLNGKAEGVVVATGAATQLGMIAALVSETKRGLTPLQEQLKRFSWLLGGGMVSLTAGVVALGVARGHALGDLITTGIALAVAAVPEGMLVALTVVLALGMRRMLQRQALVRHLVAAETLGSVSVICTDKTGTLTEGRMCVVKAITSAIEYDFDQENQRVLSLDSEINYLLTACVLNSNADVDVVHKTFIGQPTEVALLAAAHAAGIDSAVCRQEFVRLAELPFSSEKKYMATVHRYFEEEVLIVKGAPEKIFSLCKQNAALQKFEQRMRELSAQGLRLLAVAEAKKSHISLEHDIKNLDCLGLIGIQDPLRKHAADTVRELKNAGIYVVLVTGDHVETATHVARLVGLPVGNERVMSGSNLDQLMPGQLEDLIQNITVFARVEPRHKIDIVRAWQQKSQSVAMTGDGVNDAPALKAADIGVALGSGSDVAHETASIVLLDNNLSTISAAVREGRIIFDNIRKIIVYLMTDSFSEIVLIGSAFILDLPLPITAAQIFWINLVSDGLPYLALTVEPAEPDVMIQKPRSKNESIVSREMKLLIFVIGIITDFFLLTLYMILLKFSVFDFAYIRTIIFTALSIHTLFYVFSVRSMRSSFFTMNPFSNRMLNYAVVISFLMQLAVVYLPFLQDLFDTVALGFFEWFLVVGLSLVKVISIELVKHFFIATKKRPTSV
ncbi:cation-transporting P-type ATPase [Candidatus Babeliales bacterium]|nr:cation-transporting P-type ATPase [Candidatus Babeliales bacterium]